jgi:predicted GNAT family acetyltransferase
MFIPFSKQDNILDKEPFIRYEAKFNLFNTIIKSKECRALRTIDNKVIVLINPNTPIWIWIDEEVSKEQANSIINDLCNELKCEKIYEIIGASTFIRMFADIYAKLNKISYTITNRINAYECLEIKRPKDVRGKIVLAQDLHLCNVADLCEGFIFESVNKEIAKIDKFITAIKQISYKSLFLWIVDNDIVSMANIVDKSKRYARVNMVYTDKRYRHNGYASALLCEINEKLHKDGLKSMLYADEDNLICNNVYKNIGYTNCGQLENISFIR